MRATSEVNGRPGRMLRYRLDTVKSTIGHKLYGRLRDLQILCTLVDGRTVRFTIR